MLTSTVRLEGQHLANSLELVTSISTVIGLSGVEPLVPELLERVGGWLINKGNLLAGYAVGMRLNEVNDIHWLKNARRRLDHGEREAAALKLRSAPWLDVIKYAGAEVGRVIARERERRRAELARRGIRLGSIT